MTGQATRGRADADRPIGIAFVELDAVLSAEVLSRREAAERNTDQGDQVVASEVRGWHPDAEKSACTGSVKQSANMVQSRRSTPMAYLVTCSLIWRGLPAAGGGTLYRS
jgi:hypothetical protein